MKSIKTDKISKRCFVFIVQAHSSYKILNTGHLCSQTQTTLQNFILEPIYSKCKGLGGKKVKFDYPAEECSPSASYAVLDRGVVQTFAF